MKTKLTNSIRSGKKWVKSQKKKNTKREKELWEEKKTICFGPIDEKNKRRRTHHKMRGKRVLFEVVINGF